MGAAWPQPFLSLAVPTCSFLEPWPLARAAIKGPSLLALLGPEVVAKGLCPYPYVLVIVLRLELYLMNEFEPFMMISQLINE